MSVFLPKFLHETYLIPNRIIFWGRAFGRWLGQEGTAFTNRRSNRSNILLKKIWEPLGPIPLHEDTVDDPSWTGKRVLTSNQFASTLILHFSASRTVTNKSVVYKPPSLFYYSSWTRQRHSPRNDLIMSWVRNVKIIFKIIFWLLHCLDICTNAAKTIVVYKCWHLLSTD